eukprot:TRINITY_DN80767_c0_g1_i1.p1 TRINITY_DN80767_c0_g1~~TRINITY_DN80767_c0_g1_i1.p1  ORF type:complete len:199 (-),score=40.14 TRINITY_DN80767_c0_g1_i1:65-661(-)
MTQQHLFCQRAGSCCSMRRRPSFPKPACRRRLYALVAVVAAVHGGLTFCCTAPLRTVCKLAGVRRQKACLQAVASEDGATERSWKVDFPQLGMENVPQEDEAEYLARFRLIAEALPGGEDALLQLVNNGHRTVLWFGQDHLRAALAKCRAVFGEERAMDVIMKNPRVLTMAPRDIEKNKGQVETLADGMGFLQQFGLR